MEFKGTKCKWLIDGRMVYSLYRRKYTNDLCNRFYLQVWADPILENKEEEMKANAQLISKAPEMLEMIKTLLNNSDVPNEIYDQAKILIKEATTI